MARGTLEHESGFVKRTANLAMKTTAFLDGFRTRLGGLRLAAFSALILTACSPMHLGEPGLYQLPWPDEKGDYAVRAVRVETFTEPQSLQGRHVHVMVDPYLRHDQISSSTPVGRFTKTKEGLFIPADYISLQAASVHAHFERLYRMSTALGIAAQTPERVKVGLQANIADKSSRTQFKQNNAIFDRRLNSLLIVPFNSSSRSAIPIALNAGVLAHEYFHVIFQEAVLGPLGPSLPVGERITESRIHEWHDHAAVNEAPAPKQAPKPLPPHGPRPELFCDPRSGTNPEKIGHTAYNLFFLRGLNEGFADVWGWAYTGDARFIEKSIPGLADRRLDMQIARVPNREMIEKCMRYEGKVLSESDRASNSYLIGSAFARTLHSLAKELVAEGESPDREVRMEIAGVVARSLPMIGELAVKAEREGKKLAPNAILGSVYKSVLASTRASASSVPACRLLEKMAAADFDPEDKFECASAPTPAPGPTPEGMKP